jgi:hypothetical protein
VCTGILGSISCSCHWPAVLAAFTDRPCLQLQVLPAVPARTAAAAGWPCRHCSGPGVRPLAARRHKLRSLDTQAAAESAGNCIFLRQLTLPEEGDGREGGGGERGLGFLSHPRHLRSRSFRSMHRPQGARQYICTASAIVRRVVCCARFLA